MLKNKKIIYLLVSLLVSFFIFFGLEERQENQTEVSFWKKDWSTIRFLPPKETWCGKNEPTLFPMPIQMEKISRGWRGNPLFKLTQLDGKTKEQVFYEANYNVKNLFTDLSVLKTKSEELTEGIDLQKLCLSEDAPTLLLSLDSIPFDQEINGSFLRFGNKLGSDETRILALADNRIVSPYQYLIDKFKGESHSLRERQFINYNGGFIQYIELNGEGQRIRIENSAKKNQYDTYVNEWSRPTDERIVLSPSIGNDWETKLKSLRADLYLDEPQAPSYVSGKSSAKEKAIYTIEVGHSESYRWKLYFYDTVQTEQGMFRLAQREFLGHFLENHSLVKEEQFSAFLRAATEVKNASRFERPNQKIQ
ncbi:hypothetical protein LPTSP4_17980 [Leptospira ryugenii]|uniref:PF14238 domain protein n=1 Tax=Leptospira ryugenii TaxID=1917863 RepID=A0A2P2E069_9LEPT|nr:hypothetical protein [Leptospira ryugenii]GBF50273.1 hypothetical protein LPTSP4_17980 [Leptospira ryugenii]